MVRKTMKGRWEGMGQDPTRRAKQMEWGPGGGMGRVQREAVWGAELTRGVSTQHSYNGSRGQARPSGITDTSFRLPTVHLWAVGRKDTAWLQQSTLWAAGPRACSLLGTILFLQVAHEGRASNGLSGCSCGDLPATREQPLQIAPPRA